MKKVLMCTCTAFAFFVAAAVAQTNPSTDTPSQGTQGTQSSSPSMSQGNNTGTPGTMAGDNSTTQTGNMKGEKKMKGCIESEGGQYVLRTRHGKDIQLTGEDVSAHSGHEVTVHGMWASGMSGMSNTSTGGASASGKSFNVTSLDMISDTCTIGKGKKSGMSDNSTSGTGTPQPQ